MTNQISDEIRTSVVQRASGRCEYCLIDERDSGFPHQIDHIVSRKHGGLSISDNLALAFVLCNRYKGTDLSSLDPQTQELTRLFHPRQDQWSDHFRLNGAIIEGSSAVGRTTMQLLRLNVAERIAERQLLQELGRYHVEP